jgi:ferredoxin
MAKLKTDDTEVEVQDGGKIIEACETLGVPFGCEQGTCGTCQIEIAEGEDNLTELSDAEEDMGMDKKNRLACQCRIKEGTVKIIY